MSTVDDLEKRVKSLEEEIFFLRLTAENAAVNHKMEFYKKDYRYNLLKPKLLDEKLLWLEKNYWNYSPERYYRCDKYLFKYWWRKLFGSDHEIPLLGVWDRAEDIDFDLLPQQFVIKRTLSGGSFEVKIVDKKTDDLGFVRQLAKKWLSDEYGIRPKARIIAEQKLIFEDGKIIDYKFYVMNGKVTFIFCVSMNESGGYRAYSFYDPDWNEIVVNYHHDENPVLKPDKLNEMIALAERVGSYFPFMRVDLYYSQGKIYVGELTDMPFNGRLPFGFEMNRKFGYMLKLPSRSEMEESIKEFYTIFPEMVENPVFLKVYNESYFIVKPDNSSNSLPLPPKDFMQPMKASLYKTLDLEERIRSVNTNSKFALNAVSFLRKLDEDFEKEGRFEGWIDRLKSQNATISILKARDMAGRVLRQALDFKEIEVVFTSPEANFKNMSGEEIEKCCRADVIVCANVHYNQILEINNKRVINIAQILL